MELVIDGYNVIGSRGGLYGDVAAMRGAFVEELGRYARLKGHAITVVFDGFPPSRTTLVRHPPGVRVLFGEHERADDAIIRLGQRLREKGTIVSSDREVRDACRACGCVVLGAQAFDERLRGALGNQGTLRDGREIDGDQDRDTDGGAASRRDKRGNPRRLPKAERKIRKRLDRL